VGGLLRPFRSAATDKSFKGSSIAGPSTTVRMRQILRTHLGNQMLSSSRRRSPSQAGPARLLWSLPLRLQGKSPYATPRQSLLF
jgi:hypothetical protein